MFIAGIEIAAHGDKEHGKVVSSIGYRVRFVGLASDGLPVEGYGVSVAEAFNRALKMVETNLAIEFAEGQKR